MKNDQLTRCTQILKKRAVEVIDLKCIDLTGRLHHISLPVRPGILERLIDEGVGFDGSGYGFRKVENSDMVLIPDLSTAVMDPFRQASTLSFFANIFLTDNGRTPFSQDGRMIARRAEQVLKETQEIDISAAISQLDQMAQPAVQAASTAAMPEQKPAAPSPEEAKAVPTEQKKEDEDISEEDDYIIVTTAMDDFGRMQKKLEELEIVAENARLQRIPKDYKVLGVEETKKVMKALDTFEEDDDVQNVYHNLEIPDELLDEMEE